MTDKTKFYYLLKECNCDESYSPEEVHYHCLKCDCILTQYEGAICCSCEKLYPNYKDEIDSWHVEWEKDND